MIPTNVMSFMKKMVTNESNSTSTNPNNSCEIGNITSPDSSSSTTFGKIKQTLSTSLQTAHDKVNRISPKHTNQSEISNEVTTMSSTITKTDSSSKLLSRMGACRVCLKLLKPDEFYQICFECSQRVCDDCASYSKSEANEDRTKWRCSVCRRRIQSKIIVPQESTDSLLDIPISDPIQRRHSDIKMSNTSDNNDFNDVSLTIPRSSELRRHSDVSPTSLKEIEKLKIKKSTKDLSLLSRKNSESSRCSSPISKDFDFNSCINDTVEDTRHNKRPVSRQRSYDNEIRNSSSVTSINDRDHGLKVMSSMPRRASAYDVSSAGLFQSPNIDEPMEISLRRSSMRGISGFVGIGGDTTGSKSCLDDNDNIVRSSELHSQLVPDEERRGSRSASPIGDINNIRTLPSTPWSAAALEELEAPKRQLSIDAEAIRIIIHDVDSTQAQTARRRVVIRKDPNDKGHRTRGFGMRVVGGKTGIDGRLFAYIVWTVPGGSAERAGLQQGDKVLEWGGISLIEKSFEDVCSIMDHTGDTVELLVEHLSDFRMCDLFDENPNLTNTLINRRASDISLQNLQYEHDDKPILSPTRRKLPKTPV